MNKKKFLTLGLAALAVSSFIITNTFAKTMADGMPSASFSVNDNVSDYYFKSRIYQGTYHWNVTPTPAAIGRSSTSTNTINKLAGGATSSYGLYAAKYINGSRGFDIYINYQAIDSLVSGRSLTDRDKAYESVIVHELGHALSLADLGFLDTRSSIMSEYIKRYNLWTPQQYDINDVNAFY